MPTRRDGAISAAPAALLAALLVNAGCSSTVATNNAALPAVSEAYVRAATSGGFINHVVIVIQENRSFDNFFATFPGADGATSGLMKTPSGDVYQPLVESRLEMDSLGHEHYSFVLEYDHGKMDGFGLVKRELPKGLKIKSGTYAYRYVNPKYIAPYWAMAQQYVLADHMFTTQSSSSFTAHQDLIAGGTPVGGDNVIDFPTPSSWGCNAPQGTVTSLITPAGHYLRDKGPFPCFTYATMRDLLDAKGLPWLYFTNDSHAYVWNAFDAVAAVRDGPEWTTNIVIPETKIYQTIENAQLPAVTWIIPDALDSDHPGLHSDTGPSWVASVVNAIGESAYWTSTAIVVVWDDWGGYYDNVVPPQIDGQGLGMRVPMLVISPYGREAVPDTPGYISHTQYDFGSILKFMEDNWGLGRLGTSDVGSKSIVDCFDFKRPPRAFIPISAKYTRAYFERRPPSGLPVDTE
jgi:phospholipase C